MTRISVARIALGVVVGSILAATFWLALSF